MCTTPRCLSAVVRQISETLRSLRVPSRQARGLGSQPSELPAPPEFARDLQRLASLSSQWTQPHRPQYRPEDCADRSPDVDRQTSKLRRLFQHALQQSSRTAAPANLEQRALQRATQKQQSSQRHALENGLQARTTNGSLAILPEPQHEMLHDPEGQSGSAGLDAQQPPMQTAANETPRDLPGQVLSHQISPSPGMFDTGGFTARDLEPPTAWSPAAVASTVPHEEQSSNVKEPMAVPVAQQQGGAPQPGDQAGASQGAELVQPLGKEVIAADSSQQEPAASSSAAQAASPEASSAAKSEDTCTARGESSGQIAEPEKQHEEKRHNESSIKLTVNINKDAAGQMPGDGTGASKSAAAEGNGGQTSGASTSLAAELIKCDNDEDEPPAAAFIRGLELPGLAARDQQQTPEQDPASSEESGTEAGHPEQELETPRKWIPMPQVQLSTPDGSLWDAAALEEEPGLHRTMSASKRKLRPSEDSQVLVDTVTAVYNETNFNGTILTLCKKFKGEWFCWFSSPAGC